MKWLIIALMGVVFAAAQANAVSLPGSRSNTLATTNPANTVDSAIELNVFQAPTPGDGYSEMERGRQPVLAQTLVQEFEELFITSDTSKPSGSSPEPATLFLFGSGLAGCIYIFRKRL